MMVKERNAEHGTLPPRLTFSFDDREGDTLLGELILHIAARSERDPHFNTVKLDKLLWWSDFLSYAEFGDPITGVEYQKLPRGPAPKKIEEIRDRLNDNDDIEFLLQPQSLGERRFKASRRANYDLFKARHIGLVDEIIDRFADFTAEQLSEASHGKAWETASENDSIPYQAIFLSDEPINEYDITRSRELAEKFNWKGIAHERGAD